MESVVRRRVLLPLKALAASKTDEGEAEDGRIRRGKKMC